MVRLFLLVLLAASLRAQNIAEQYLMVVINQERAGHDLPPVRTDVSLSRAAALHAEEMARRGAISHQFPGEPDLAARGSAAGARFDRITENVAEGPSILGMHGTLMRSHGHRANILDPAVDTVGTAVITRGGQLYAVEDFARAVPPLSFAQQEAAVALLLERAGLELLPNQSARGTCALAEGYAGDEPPVFVMRYTTADLSQLPSELIRRLRMGRERHAAVGACASGSSLFSQYSLAVMLFR